MRFDSGGIVRKEFVSEGRTMNEQFYLEVME
jgi:hypothetical protein